MGERLYVYGGIGQGQQQLSDIHFFSISEALPLCTLAEHVQACELVKGPAAYSAGCRMIG